MDEQLLREFLAEAEELIEELFGDVRRLRERRAEGRARRELVGRVFRHVHTIKGTAYAAGLTSAGRIAHEFESLLDGVRKGRAPLDAETLDAFEDAVQAVAESLGAAARGRTDEPAPPSLVERLRRLASAAQPEHSPEVLQPDQPPPALAALPPDILQTLSEYETHRLRESVAEGAHVYVVAAEFDLATFDEQFRRLSEALSQRGEIVTTVPGVSAGAPERVHFRVVYAAAEPRASVESRVRHFGAVLLGEERVEEGAAGERSGDELPGGPTRAAREPGPGDDSASLPSAYTLTPLVRVPLDALDDLNASLHELAADASAALDLALARGVESSDELATRASVIRRRFLELEEKLLGLRMVSAARTLERAARAGASVARAAGKEVDFEIAGGEVRLDKPLADALAEPLLHVLRNAVDHGIETAVERAAEGKPARGRVRLEASSEGGRVVFRVEDDGRGIDPAAVARAAGERGLVARGARVSEAEARRLIFRPGFTTAPRVSPLSGRGVGLDAVERAVEQLGGEVRVRSRAGRGATFELRAPTTLALVRALVVSSAGYLYCVDERHAADIVRVPEADTEQAGGATYVRWRGGRLPLVRLRALLGQDAPHESGGEETFAAVVVPRANERTGGGEEEGERATRYAAVVVDAVDERPREVLARSLGRHAPRWYGVSGAAELRDGRVALLLDLPRLLETRL